MDRNSFNPEITCLQLQISRVSDGLRIFARAANKFEAFFKNASENQVETLDVRINGCYWAPKDGSNFMKFYFLTPDLPFMHGMATIMSNLNFSSYRLDAPFKRIIEPDERKAGNIVNISFLRSVGISDEGIEFTIKGVYSEAQVRSIHDGILTATNAFYEAYLRPINLTINLQEG